MTERHAMEEIEQRAMRHLNLHPDTDWMSLTQETRDIALLAYGGDDRAMREWWSMVTPSAPTLYSIGEKLNRILRALALPSTEKKG